MSWKKLLHPEIQKHYSLIVKDGLSEVKNTNDVSNFEDVKSIEWQKSLLDKIPDNTF